MSEHTPGPWKVDRSWPRRLPFGVSSKDKSVLNSRAFSRATTPEAEANARLISKAWLLPEMVEALRGEQEHLKTALDWAEVMNAGIGVIRRMRYRYDRMGFLLKRYEETP